MKTSTNTYQSHSETNIFNYQDFNDSLAHVMQRYNALHIEKMHNQMATALMNGAIDKTMVALTDRKINKIQEMLQKIDRIVKQFSL